MKKGILPESQNDPQRPPFVCFEGIDVWFILLLLVCRGAEFPPTIIDRSLSGGDTESLLRQFRSSFGVNTVICRGDRKQQGAENKGDNEIGKTSLFVRVSGWCRED